MKKSEVNEIRSEIVGIENGSLAPGRVRNVRRLPDGTIERVEIDPAQYRRERARAWEAKTDVAQVRHVLDLTQKAFASMMGVSLDTLRKWEHGTTSPSGAARTLLILAATHPDAVKEAAKKAHA